MRRRTETGFANAAYWTAAFVGTMILAVLFMGCFSIANSCSLTATYKQGRVIENMKVEAEADINEQMAELKATESEGKISEKENATAMEALEEVIGSEAVEEAKTKAQKPISQMNFTEYAESLREQ